MVCRSGPTETRRGAVVPRIVPVACSLGLESVLRPIQDNFNRLGYFDREGSQLHVDCHYYEDAEIISGVVQHDFELFIPSSSLSFLSPLAQWEEKRRSAEIEVDLSVFASTPIIFLMSSDTYAGHAEQGDMIGWESLITGQHDRRLAHAHGTTNDGLAVMVAEWIWACGGRVPSAEDMVGSPRDRVANLERRVVAHAPNDATLLERSRGAGVDITLVQERAALSSLSTMESADNVIVYPSGGTVWLDYVLGRARFAGRDVANEPYQALITHLGSEESVDHLLGHGMHPPGPGLGSKVDSSRIVSALPPSARRSVRIVNAGAGPVKVPGYKTVNLIYRAWYTVARAAEILLVLDCSESMKGAKLLAACEAIRTFCKRPQGSGSTIGLVTFQESAVVAVPLQPMELGGPAIDSFLSSVHADGRTALFDAVSTAAVGFGGSSEYDGLRAIILLTDGQENASTANLGDALAAIARVSVTTFAIAYGSEADVDTLRLLAGTSGLTVSASIGDIDAIYDSLSSHM
jgi:uncharacterized protein YegL